MFILITFIKGKTHHGRFEYILVFEIVPLSNFCLVLSWDKTFPRILSCLVPRTKWFYNFCLVLSQDKIFCDFCLVFCPILSLSQRKFLLFVDIDLRFLPLKDLSIKCIFNSMMIESPRVTRFNSNFSRTMIRVIADVHERPFASPLILSDNFFDFTWKKILPNEFQNIIQKCLLVSSSWYLSVGQ